MGPLRYLRVPSDDTEEPSRGTTPPIPSQKRRLSSTSAKTSAELLNPKKSSFFTPGKIEPKKTHFLDSEIDKLSQFSKDSKSSTGLILAPPSASTSSIVERVQSSDTVYHTPTAGGGSGTGRAGSESSLLLSPSSGRTNPSLPPKEDENKIHSINDGDKDDKCNQS